MIIFSEDPRMNGNSSFSVGWKEVVTGICFHISYNSRLLSSLAHLSSLYFDSNVIYKENSFCKSSAIKRGEIWGDFC